MPLSVALRRQLPIIGATLATEALVRAGIDPHTQSNNISAEQTDLLTASVQQILLDTRRPSPRVYLDQAGIPVFFSIIELRQAEKYQTRMFPSVSDAVRYFLGRRKAVSALDGDREILRTRIRSQIEKAQRTLKAIDVESREAERAAEYERLGSLLMANLSPSTRGEKRVVVEGPEGDVEITLDPKFTRLQNAQQYFQRAKRAKTASGKTLERKEELHETLQKGGALLKSLDGCESLDHLKKAMAEQKDEFAEFGVGEHGETDPFPFKRFVVDGGFEVWAGKNSQNNDELTLRHSKPMDLWFHARGSSGSHVILRVSTGKGEPSKRAREEAASIAAYYSKMRGAGLVPVAMTEKRYVRKPKGAKPGSVVIEREKVLMVRPKLPTS